MTDVTKTTDTGRELIIPGLENFQQFDDQINELPPIIPYYRIGQKDDMGYIVDNMGGRFDQLDAIIVKITASRVMWQKPFNRNIKYPLCRSFDGVEPDINLFITGRAEGQPPASKCAECRHASADDEMGGWRRPACDTQFNLWGFDVINTNPFVLSLFGVSLATKCKTKGHISVKQFISQIKMSRKNMFMFNVVIKSGIASGDAGDVGAGIFLNAGEMDFGTLSKYADVIRELATMKTTALEKAGLTDISDDMPDTDDTPY